MEKNGIVSHKYSLEGPQEVAWVRSSRCGKMNCIEAFPYADGAYGLVRDSFDLDLIIMLATPRYCEMISEMKRTSTFPKELVSLNADPLAIKDFIAGVKLGDFDWEKVLQKVLQR